MPSKKSYLSGWFVDTEYPNSLECSKVQGDAGIYGSLLLGLLITFQETKQECSSDADGLRQGRDKEFLSSEKSKEVVGVFTETDYSPITLGSSLDLRSGLTHHGLNFWLFSVLLGTWCLDMGPDVGKCNPAFSCSLRSRRAGWESYLSCTGLTAIQLQT